MTFETVSEATHLWIKGQDFPVTSLLGDDYKGQAEKYNGGALAIFCLAPQDYHCFHSPVDGKIGPMTYISGEYYTASGFRPSLDLANGNPQGTVGVSPNTIDPGNNTQ